MCIRDRYLKTLGDSIDALLYKDGSLWVGSDGLLYKHTDDGGEKLYIFPESGIVSLAADSTGSVLVGTSEMGRVYRINNATSTAENLFESDINMVCSILPAADGSLIISTGNPGKLMKIKPTYNLSGSYTSKVIDTGRMSKFGKIVWTADLPPGTGITLQTRTGNSLSPDSTWSDWSYEYGWMDEGQLILSPLARFIQVRANLTTTDETKTPLLSDIQVYYKHRNKSPLIEFESLTGGEKLSGTVKIEWRAYIANPESLSFSLFYSSDNGVTWKPIEENISPEIKKVALSDNLFTEKKPELQSYSWSTTKVNDGKYMIKLRAFDISEPDNDNLACEIISKPIIVTNTKPEVTITEKAAGENRATVTGFVKTKLACVREVVYLSLIHI